MVKKLISVVAVAAMFFSASAQNARVDAMGGCSIIPDISRTLRLPADMNGYPDQMQGTVYSGPLFGSVLGIKGIGDMFRVGVMMPTVDYVVEYIEDGIDPTTGAFFTDTTYIGSGSSVLRSNFYADALDILDYLPFSVGELPDAFPHIPHILFGINLDPVTIGLDFFMEMTRYKYESISEAGGVKTETTEEAKITNVGGILSANIDINALSISPRFGIGVPKVSGLDESKDPQTSVKNEITSESGIFLTVGTELGFELNDFNLVGGFFFTNESYQFNVDDTLQNEQANRFIDAYLGFTTEIRNSLLFVAQYGLGIEIENDIDTNTNGGRDYKEKGLSHSFRFGLERPIEGVWIFDALTPRAGLVYVLSGEKFSVTNSGGDKYELSMNDPNYAGQAQLTTGLGLSKGIAAIDINVVIGSWDGALTGPSVIEGTLTLDFGKRSSASSTSSYQSAPPPLVSEPPSDETGSEDSGESSDIDFDF